MEGEKIREREQHADEKHKTTTPFYTDCTLQSTIISKMVIYRSLSSRNIYYAILKSWPY